MPPCAPLLAELSPPRALLLTLSLLPRSRGALLVSFTVNTADADPSAGSASAPPAAAAALALAPFSAMGVTVTSALHV